MRSLIRLPAFYLCLLVFAVVLFLFQNHREDRVTSLKKPAASLFRLRKTDGEIMLYESVQAKGHPSDGTHDTHQMTHPPPPPPSPPAAPTTTITTLLEEEEEEGRGGAGHKEEEIKTILVWTFGYGAKTMGFGEGRAPFQQAGCEVDKCIITGNRTLVPLPSYDAVIFHFRSLSKNDLPSARSPHQRWIFWEMESASYIYQDLAIYNGLFNWTMTYRLDSDVLRRYGRVYPVSSSSSSSSFRSSEKNYASGKTKMAAWFVSNCFTISRREKIVRFMKKHMQVDVFGKCGSLTCPREKSQECYAMLGRDYKFYLSFENSLCKDYVTEKFFSILKQDVVPVVFGLANYTSVAPPHSFINVMDFPTVKGLVKYLKYLDANDTAYNEYFAWKEHYQVENDRASTTASFCDLCKKLHQDDRPKVYNDLMQWFVVQSNCKRLDGIGKF